MSVKEIYGKTKLYVDKGIWNYILMNIIVKSIFFVLVSILFIWSFSSLIESIVYFARMEELGLSNYDLSYMYKFIVSVVKIYFLVVVSNIFATVVNSCFTISIYKSIKTDEMLTLEGPFMVFKRYWFKLLLFTLLLTVIISFVWWIPFLPTVIGYAGSFTLLIIFDEDVDVLSAFKESIKRTKGHKWNLFKMNFIYNAIMIVGVLLAVLVWSLVGHMIGGAILSIVVWIISLGLTVYYSFYIYALTPIYYKELTKVETEAETSGESIV